MMAYLRGYTLAHLEMKALAYENGSIYLIDRTLLKIWLID